jgi:MscS family membrane protein
MRRPILCIALVAALAPSASFAQNGERADGGETAEPAQPLPPERLEVKGTCSTPRQAWLQHLYWAARERFDRAAACFDGGALTEAQAAELAERLFDHLNANALFIDTADSETVDPDYTDGSTGEHLYADPKASAFTIRKYSDGKWRFTPEALEAIPGFSLGKRLARMLPPWFQTKFLGVPVWSYIGVLLLIFIAFIARRVVVFVVNRYVTRWARRAQIEYLDNIADEIDRPFGGLSMAAVFFIGFPLLSFPVRAATVALVAVKALAAFSLVWLAYRLIDVVAAWLGAKAEGTESKLDDQLVPLITKTLKVFVSVLGGIFVLQNLDVNVSSLLAGVGLGGLAFALAAKDTVANFFGSVMIFVDKPFQIGDWVKIGDAEGTVIEVGFRTTRIRTFYDSQITVPNSLIANTKIDNLGVRTYRRYMTNLGLTYDTSPEKVQAFCEGVRAVIARLDGMRKDYYLVEFKEFGDFNLQVLLYCFMHVETFNEEMRVRTQLNLEILRVAAELGVEFAFPTQTIHVDTLAKASEKPASKTPSSLDDIAGVVERFGPGGELARAGYEISRGYDCRTDWTAPSDGSNGRSNTNSEQTK